MLRNIWLSICGTLLCGGVGFAQQPNPAPTPFGNPGAYGYPGYPPPLPMGPMPGNASPPPMQPYGPPQSMMPMGPGGMMPYGNPGPMGPGGMPPYLNPGWMGTGVNPYSSGNPQPGPIPPDPRRPVGLPSYNGVGPKQGAAEPYMVGSERNPTIAQPPASGPALTLPPAPAYAPTPVMADPYVEFAAGAMPAPPAEPYTLYEGARYQADVKQDNVVVFGQVNYVHWWTRRDQTPPLLTTGNSTSVNPGSLANTDTSVLLGGRSIGPNEFSGAQTNLGIWLDPERLTSFELGGFYLGKNSRQYAFASDVNGTQVFAQPVSTTSTTTPGYSENSLVITYPGILSGGASFSSVMNMAGAEANFGRNLIRYNGWTLDALAGFRYMYLNDTLLTRQNFTVLPAAAGFVDFVGVPQPAGANFALNDSFNLTNRFYGGQIGARVDWVSSFKLDFGAIVKVAFGDTTHTAIVDGSTTVTNGTNNGTAPGGAYSQPSDIGVHNSNDFSVVTELNFTVGYQIHPNVRLTAGYNLIYWPRVERAGEQIDRMIDLAQVPSSNAYVPGATGTYPRFLNTRSDFWAQGINVGIEVKY